MIKIIIAFWLAIISPHSIAQDPVSQFICNFNKKLTVSECDHIAAMIRVAAKDDQKMVLHATAVAGIESGFQHQVKSRGGAGLMQITKIHYPKLEGQSPIAIGPNLIVGIGILRACMEKSKSGSAEKMFACYNGGGTKGYARNALAFERKVSSYIATVQKPIAVLQ